MNEPHFELHTRLVSPVEELSKLPANPEKKIDRNGLVQQVTIPGGKSSCFVASTVNGLIARRYIVPKDGETLHKKLVFSPKFDDLWAGNGLEALGLLGWSGGTAKIVSEASSLAGKDIPPPVYPSLYMLSPAEQIGICTNLLRAGYVFLAEEPRHTCLAVGYDTTSDLVELVDPRNPKVPRTLHSSDFADRFQLGSVQII